ncbi:MAG: ferritin-like fold-containing protein [Nocardioides sp.]
MDASSPETGEPEVSEPEISGSEVSGRELDWYAEPAYQAAVIDLLGAIAYGELSAFERLAEDAKLAPTLQDKVALARLASSEFVHLDGLLARLRALGADPTVAMTPFRAAVDGFHLHTAPRDWLEGLLKAYVGDGLAADFYREIAVLLDGETRAVIDAALTDSGHADFVVERVRQAIEADPRIAGRLALWSRRLMGEALSQAQRVVAERDELSTFLGMLLAGSATMPGMDLAEIGSMFNRLTKRHVQRMSTLGLDP